MSYSLRPARSAALLLGALALVAGIPSASADDDDPAATVANVQPLQADVGTVVHNEGDAFTWHVVYGPTTDYGQETDDVDAAGGQTDTPIATTLSGLTPGTTYHARVKWSIDDDHGRTPDVTFTTPPAGTDAAPAELVPPAPGADPAAPPVAALAVSAVTTVSTGEVRVRIPGWTASAPLAPQAHIPIGSVLDTRAGAVRVTTALASGATQSATFRGGIFALLQSPALGGMTDIALRASAPHACAASARAAGTRRKPRELGRLWGSDRNGRYRTHGANSVATVRGTSWLTVERCDGTLTEVTKGAVSVFDRRTGKRVLVRAGERYLARKG